MEIKKNRLSFMKDSKIKLKTGIKGRKLVLIISEKNYKNTPNKYRF